MEDKKNLTEMFKKIVQTGVSAAFLNEEAIKEVVNGLPIPKEMMSTLLQSAKTSRDDFIASIKKEFKSYLDKVDISKEIDRVLENYDIEVNAKVKFKKKPKRQSKGTVSKSNE